MVLTSLDALSVQVASLAMSRELLRKLSVRSVKLGSTVSTVPLPAPHAQRGGIILTQRELARACACHVQLATSRLWEHRCANHAIQAGSALKAHHLVRNVPLDSSVKGRRQNAAIALLEGHPLHLQASARYVPVGHILPWALPAALIAMLASPRSMKRRSVTHVLRADGEVNQRDCLGIALHVLQGASGRTLRVPVLMIVTSVLLAPRVLRHRMHPRIV
mmetsp:Transcript_37886/g.87579  ORF Transcript_37886/g.87579 Transcript_37886/m.87579 type:complete len:219 (-) Transcript_37886:190-846(-)